MSLLPPRVTQFSPNPMLYTLARIMSTAAGFMFITFTLDCRRGRPFSKTSSFCALLFLAWLHLAALTAETQVTRLTTVASLAFIFMRFLDLYCINAQKRHEKTFWSLGQSFIMTYDQHCLQTAAQASKVWTGFLIPFELLGFSPRLAVAFAVIIEGMLQVQFGKLLFRNVYLELKERVNVYEWPPYSVLPSTDFFDRIAFCLCFTMLLYIFINTVFKALLPISMILNGEYKGSFDRVWLSSSVQDFWRNRWNLLFQEAFYRIIGSNLNSKTTKNQTRGPKQARLAILTATFLFSGLLHDWLIWYGMNIEAGSRTFEMTCFFMAQVVGIVLEQRVLFYVIPKNGILTRFWTYSWLILTCPLFIRPFLFTTNVQPDPLSNIF